ncbi:outer membrane protein [Bartonella quintana]|uniref:outer membrane protein n=1 Tax=Bartonella quintana TaxID=803 RepID=UPI001ABB4EE0|nr:outer membrane protein [Bartonella quintana]
MNTKRLITVSIFALVSASAAQAADVGIPHQSAPTSLPVIAAPAFTWTGFYAGIQIGGFSSKTDMSIVGKGKSVLLSKDLLPKLSGFESGLYAGSNIDLGDNFIFNIDTDLIWSGQKYTKTIALGASDNVSVDNLVTRSRRSLRLENQLPGKSPKRKVQRTAPAAPTPAATAASAASAAPAASVTAPGSPVAPSSLTPTVSRTSGRSVGTTEASAVPGTGGLHLARSGDSKQSVSGTQAVLSAHHGTDQNAHSHRVNNPHGNPHGGSSAAGRSAQGEQTVNEKSASVYGIEEVKKVAASLGVDQGGRAETLTHTLKQNWAGATRLRIGFAADRIMPYVAGGIAYTQLQDIVSISLKEQDGEAVSRKNLTNETKTMIGYTLGGGIDFAMTDNVLLRAEYRYSGFGKKKFAKEKLEVNYKTNDFRIGVAYKF